MKKDFLTPSDLSADEVFDIIATANKIKSAPSRYKNDLEGISVALLFQKTSTRTRTAFEVGIAEMGGIPIYLYWDTTNFRRADLKDEIVALSQYVDIIVARINYHSDLNSAAGNIKKPLVNALSEVHHPTQVLSDIFTIIEHFGKLEGIKIVYIGDGNNICNSLIEFAVLLGFNLTVVTPEQYMPDSYIIKKCENNNNIIFSNDPILSVHDANVVYTDAWISIGQEKEKREKIKSFAGFTIDGNIIEAARDDVVVMHCLPVYRGYEITSSVLDSCHSIVKTQAENKKYIKKSLLKYLVKASTP